MHLISRGKYEESYVVGAEEIGMARVVLVVIEACASAPHVEIAVTHEARRLLVRAAEICRQKYGAAGAGGEQHRKAGMCLRPLRRAADAANNDIIKLTDGGAARLSVVSKLILKYLREMREVNRKCSAEKLLRDVARNKWRRPAVIWLGRGSIFRQYVSASVGIERHSGQYSTWPSAREVSSQRHSSRQKSAAKWQIAQSCMYSASSCALIYHEWLRWPKVARYRPQKRGEKFRGEKLRGMKWREMVSAVSRRARIEKASYACRHLSSPPKSHHGKYRRRL